jgi:uncharacterized membrane protein YedE/YeeE
MAPAYAAPRTAPPDAPARRRAWPTRLAGAVVGLVFGFTLVWSGLTNPEVIHRGLVFEDLYLILFFVAALATAFVGTQALRRLRPRALLTGEPVEWTVERPNRRRLWGAVLFGTGWAVAGACPGPVAAQLGQGVAWSVFTLVGLVVGIVVALRLAHRYSESSLAAARSSVGSKLRKRTSSTSRGSPPRPDAAS